MYWQDSPISVLDVYQELIISGLRIWMFSGDTDAVIPTASTRYSIDALNLTTISPWRAWYEDAQVLHGRLKLEPSSWNGNVNCSGNVHQPMLFSHLTGFRPVYPPYANGRCMHTLMIIISTLFL
ncbi:putative carboxypeptidase D [Helianthus annuus]|nr:putative carboxypeptidase D [Helianthus annuus]